MKKLTARKHFETAPELMTAMQSLAGGVEFSAGEYKITVERVEEQRTSAQNKFYWELLNDIADQTGNDAEDLHEHFRARFLQDHTRTPARIMSTTELDVRQFVTYLDKIMSFVCAEMGLSVKTPREF